MPLFRRGQPRQTRPLVASAAHVKLGDRVEAERLRRLRQGWQNEAWAYRDAIGEIRYPTEFMANAVTRMRIYPALMVAPDEPPVKLDEADGVPADLLAAALDDVARLGADEGLRPILAGQYVNNKIAGEMYLVGRVDPDTGEEDWSVRSIDELIIDTSAVAWLRDDPGATVSDGDLERIDPDTSYVARMWTPHKRFRALADSPMRAILDRCEELLLLSRTVRADARSRLGGSGLLIIARELEMLGVNQDGDDEESDPFFSELAKAMLTPISDEADASAVVPIVARVPGEFIKEGKAAQHIDFARPFSDKAMELRTELIGRIATGLDLPKEVVTGVVDLNHWTAWQVDDNTFRHHIEPDVITQVDELTAAYVQPMLTARSSWDPSLVRRVCWWYDPVELVTHPDRSADAQQAFDRGAIGRAVLREVTGFGDDAAPDAVDEALYVLKNSRGAPPEVVTALIQKFVPGLNVAAAADELTPDATGSSQPPPPAGPAEPGPPPGPEPPRGGGGPTTAAGTPVPAPENDREPQGVMVAFYPTAEQAQQLALDSGEAADTIHVTLAYLGHAEDLTDDQVQALHDTCEQTAGGCAPLDGEFGGIGRFTADGSDDGDPVYASVDVPGLGSLRDALCQQLAAAGLPLAGDHGFTPHATLAYIDPADPMPAHRLDPVPASFAALSLVVGPDRTDYPLTGSEPPLVAAAPARRTAHAASRTLLDVDRELRALLLAAADAAVRRQLERAAARLRSRAQKDPALRAALSTVTADVVAVTLGAATVEQLGVADTDLIDPTWPDLAGKWESWVRRAQRRARLAAAEIVGSDDGLGDLEATQDTARSAGWATLAAALTSLAFTRLYDPHPDAPPVGEHDPNLTVPAAVIRAAVAVAGSDPAVSDPAVSDLAGAAALDLPVGAFGIGSGDAVTAFLEGNGAERQHYTWVHGDADRPLDAHVALSGYEFTGWDDPGLVNRDTFPEVEVLAPGDHEGCTCDAWITWAASSGELPVAASA